MSSTAPSHQPVLLVAGINDRSSPWGRWTRQLDRRGIPSMVVEVPDDGFATRAAYLQAIEGARLALLAREGLDPSSRVDIVGYSAGGVAAVDFLRAHPQLVDQTIVFSSPLRGSMLASIASFILGASTPAWVRDLTVRRAVARTLDPSIAGRVTSIVGRPFDGMVTQLSGTLAGARVIRLPRPTEHAYMVWRDDNVRSTVLELLAAGT